MKIQDLKNDAGAENKDPDLMDKVNLACERIVKGEAEIEKQEEKIKKYKEIIEYIKRIEIPDLMDKMNLEDFKLKDGSKVKVNQKVAASISEANKPDAFKWLEDNKHSDLIKCNLTIKFNREELEKAQKLEKELLEKEFVVSSTNSVHPQTLASFVREQLEQGKNIPQETLGVFMYREAKITKGK